MEMARSILETFEFEENTIFHVENWLVHNGIKLNRTEIKKKLSDFLLMGLLRLYDDPSKGQTHFQDSSDEFEEDYWFVLTEAGKKKLIELS